MYYYLMRLIVGLGNPGDRYKDTRHNAGFVVVDKLAQELEIRNWESSKKHLSLITSQESLLLAKPQTFMNRSGDAVASLVNFYKISTDTMYVIHDDLDIKLGEYKIVKGKGPREHNGLLDVYEKLGTKDFWHVRIGVDNRSSLPITNHTSPITPHLKGEDYVLQNFTKEELIVIDKVIELVINELKIILKT